MRVPWTARRSNNSILKEINPEYSLEGLKLQLEAETPKLWPFDMKNQLKEKILMLGKIEGRRKRWEVGGRGRATEGEMVGWHH